MIDSYRRLVLRAFHFFISVMSYKVPLAQNIIGLCLCLWGSQAMEFTEKGIILSLLHSKIKRHVLARCCMSTPCVVYWITSGLVLVCIPNRGHQELAHCFFFIGICGSAWPNVCLSLPMISLVVICSLGTLVVCKAIDSTIFCQVVD